MKKGKNNPNYRHGYTVGKTSNIYKIWYGIIERCTNPTNKSYAYYGGRGIEVSEDWRKSVSNFVRDMGIPKSGLTIDRIDVNGNYCKENCRWATRKQQSENKRKYKNTTFLTHNGETLSIKEWAKKLDIKYITLYARIKYYNLSIEEALTRK